MSSEIRALPSGASDRIRCAHCRRLFTPLLLAGAPVPQFCSYLCAMEASDAISV